ncbi:hypothetical protein O181_123011 [Austropuccinia psidii MF-1]|uniref:Uncharacterized protein n=1 Tax=Austropuccinia psidii MF-1 TaxID=1389203 RepID=A0A9Q3Q2W7_9BASI|nr:hypothetical protein [Austropuccinia psidii MF-1]
MAEPDFEDHEGRSTPNHSTITQAIVEVETCMMSSKTAHLLKRLLKNQQSKWGPTRIGIALVHHSIPQGKAMEDFFNNPECEVLIASIPAARTGLNITCANIFYLMVRGPPKFCPDFWTPTSNFPGAQLEPRN